MGAKHDIFFKIAVPAGYSIKMGPDGKKYVAYEPTDVGTVDHAALESNLAWADSGHTGTASSIATFDAQGDTSVISFTEGTTDFLREDGTFAEPFSITYTEGTTDFLREDGTFAEPPGTAVAGTDNIGYLNIPVNSKSADYTTVLGDAGKCILHPASDTNARTFTIDSNANVAYPIGTVILFKNNTAQAVTIAITSDTLTLDGTGTTGSRTLAQYGKATALKETATTWSIGGVNLT